MWLGRNWSGHRKALLLCKLLLPKILPFVIIIHPSIIILSIIIICCHQYQRHHCSPRCCYDIPPDQNKKAPIVSIKEFTPKMFSVSMLEQPTQIAIFWLRTLIWIVDNLLSWSSIIEIDLSVWPHHSVCSQFGLILSLSPPGLMPMLMTWGGLGDPHHPPSPGFVLISRN